MKIINCIFQVCLFIFLTSSCQKDKEIQLFDGQTLSGWEGSSSDIRIENGAIIGGNLEKKLANDFYLCTTQEYSNFELTLLAKLKYSDIEKANAGIYFRATRTKLHKVGGYEADIGYIKPAVVAQNTDYSPVDMNIPFSLWGSLIDEGREDTSRYPKGSGVVPLQFSDRELIQKVVKPQDWNEIKVIAIGNNIEIRVNGKTTAKYTETDNASAKGFICLQIHKGPYEIHYKDIRIRKID